jgi:hypothetical protein
LQLSMKKNATVNKMKSSILYVINCTVNWKK